MKNTIKNTSVTASATLLQIPKPNHSAKIGARITRGIEFAALTTRKITNATMRNSITVFRKMP